MYGQIKMRSEFLGKEDASVVLFGLMDNVSTHPSRDANDQELRNILGNKFQGRFFRKDINNKDWDNLQNKIVTCLDNPTAQQELLPLIESLLL